MLFVDMNDNPLIASQTWRSLVFHLQDEVDVLGFFYFRSLHCDPVNVGSTHHLYISSTTRLRVAKPEVRKAVVIRVVRRGCIQDEHLSGLHMEFVGMGKTRHGCMIGLLIRPRASVHTCRKIILKIRPPPPDSSGESTVNIRIFLNGNAMFIWQER